MLGIKAPLTSYRLRNMTSENLVDVAPTLALCGELPYTMNDGIELTTQWLERPAETASAQRQAA